MMLMNDVEVVEFLERKYIEIHEKAKVCGKLIPNFSANAKYERNLEMFKEFINNSKNDDLFEVADGCWRFNTKLCKEIGEKHRIGHTYVVTAIYGVIRKLRIIAEKYQIEFDFENIGR